MRYAPVRTYLLVLMENIAKDDKKKVLRNMLKDNIERFNINTIDAIHLVDLYTLVEKYIKDEEYLQSLKKTNGINPTKSQLESEKKAMAANLSRAEREKLNLASSVESSQIQIANLESASDSMNTLISLKDQQLREIKYQRQIDAVEQLYTEMQLNQNEEIISYVTFDLEQGKQINITLLDMEGKLIRTMRRNEFFD